MSVPGGPSDDAERIGVFGGTFDPVHNGHLAAAAHVRAELGLDRVLVVVAGEPWQKQGHVVARAAQRLRWVELAVEDVDGLEASGLELDRAGPSYTVDTLEALARPGRSLFLILGADAAAGLATWHRTDDLPNLATLVVMTRAGDRGAGPRRFGADAVVPCTVPRLDVSSSEVRARLAAGLPVDGLVPGAVVRDLWARGAYTAR